MAAVTFLLFNSMFQQTQSSSESHVSSLVGASASILTPIPENGLGQIAAEATLSDLSYYRSNFRKIIATRERLSRELTKLGFRVLPSQTNFILARPPKSSAMRSWISARRAI